jgi:prepilin-type N-terminal cleavage/methylation domain-containing protein
MRAKRGFTLIEVLIVIIILGILATIAVPQFANMIKRARLGEAWTGLGAARTAAEVWKLENGNYAGMTINALGIEDTPNFTYSVNTTGGNSFVLTATGRSGGPAGLDGNVMAQVNSDGYRSSSITGSGGIIHWSN